jgi:hypothetical protein
MVTGLFNVAGTFITTMTEHATDFDNLAVDAVKILLRNRLPSRRAHVIRSPEDVEKANLSRSTLLDLCFVSLESEDSKCLLKHAMLRATEHEREHEDSGP